jgi:predicted GNAT superfamily acetyltransferase
LNIVTLRPISIADRADILRINAGSRPAVAALDRAELDRLLALGEGHRVAVAGDGAVVAYMLVFAHTCAYEAEEFQYFLAHLQQPFLYVDQLAVDPGRNRSGIGSRLYAALLELARKRQIEWLCCEVNTSPPNPASLDFHRHLGFTAMGNGDTLDGRRVTFLVRKV